MEPMMPPQAQAGFGAMPPQAAAGVFGALPPNAADDFEQAQAGMGGGMGQAQAQAGMGQAMPPQAHAGYGRSPDGMGAYLSEPGGQMIDQTSSTNYWPQQMQGEMAFLEPQDTSGRATLQSAGFTALLVALTTGVGLAWGKGWGAVAGLTVGAGFANVYRAQKWMNDPDPSRRHEAIVSATVTVGEAVVAGYAIYKASKARKGS